MSVPALLGNLESLQQNTRLPSPISDYSDVCAREIFRVSIDPRDFANT